jgi:hypothetical protein
MTLQNNTPQEPEPEEEIKPCHHMETLVSGLADGSLSGPARWYTWMHVSYCRKCHAALDAFRALRAHLGHWRSTESEPNTTALTPERRAALDAAMDRIDIRRDESNR